MPNSDFRPYPGNFGEEYIVLHRTLPATAITAAGTTTVYLPTVASPVSAFPELLYYKGGALVLGGTAPSFTQATTARVAKRTSGGVVTGLSGYVTIATGGATGTVYVFPALAGATDSQLTVRPNSSDNIIVEIVNAATGTVITQPSDVLVGVKVAALK